MLLEIGAEEFRAFEEWPAEQLRALTALEGIAGSFVSAERKRQRDARPVILEEKGRLWFDVPDGQAFEISGIADRIDLDPSGAAWVFDYKSGQLPSRKEQTYFDRQIPITALMAKAGAFSKDGQQLKTEIVRGGYLGVGRKTETSLVEIDQDVLRDTREALIALLSQYAFGNAGFTARAKVQTTDKVGDFDHLARFGEWDDSTPATAIEVGS